ncbi:type II toxin-antitoxin system ParD family antitoxin [Exilibacterium tricleocarpae]|uniref:Antitoxin ParD n=1 Tax=Exilibacterium tricleocarpae TaxID=2591008 RepID=A0A545SLA6_9GAMM|nr:type II toxin-antitoxin system ParD family antitoxin [Exilibacterium tricleocarpae]TQV65748.1 type II toxin-antitoxin system ParD family antitoxin [Exilibacterium tricleocarpae]
MNVSLTSELENYVKAKVATGMYNSVSEVMREALRLMEERDAMQAVRLEALRQDINKGLDSLEREGSKPLDMEAIKAKGRTTLAGNSN